MIRILIADDHRLIRETWTYILNHDAHERFKVIASCENTEDAIRLTSQKHPDVVLMDVNMAPFSGMEATRRIKEVWPQSKVIGLSMHSQPSYARKMMQCGARGYITKNSSREEMMEAIVEVHGGKKYVCSEIKDIIAEQPVQQQAQLAEVNTLTEREMEIINLIKQGQSSKEISDTLGISLKTVEAHRHNILKKLKLKNAASLVNFMNNLPLYS
jgi:DNA-binding NarL/FixJ family response regulator